MKFENQFNIYKRREPLKSYRLNQARLWRNMRAENRGVARLVYRARKRALDLAAEEIARKLWGEGTSGGLVDLL